MNIEPIKDSEFPTGPGGRYRSKNEFWDLMRQILNMKQENGALKISGVGQSNTSAISLRTAITKELKMKHREKHFELVTRADEDGIYSLYIRRLL